MMNDLVKKLIDAIRESEEARKIAEDYINSLRPSDRQEPSASQEATQE